MALQQNKMSKSRRDKRRSHHKVHVKNPSVCSHCGKMKRPHYVCSVCGYYNDAEIIKVAGEKS